MLKAKSINAAGWLIFLLAILNVALHLVFTGDLEYHRDELLYFSLGLHPAFGYATVPPMIGWIAMLMEKIFGYSLFAIRIFPALLSGVLVYLVAAIARELGGSVYSGILAATGMVLSISGLRTYMFFMPVHIDIFFWTLSFYLLIKYVNTQSGKYLILFGIAAGLGLLNKYLIALLFVLFLLIIPFTRHRTVFSNKYFWFGILAGALIFMPNLIWQIVNGLPVINHMAELERTQLVNVGRISFLIEQLLISGAASFLTVAGIIYLFTSRDAKKFRFIAIVTISVIITLMILRGKSYYTQGIFPVLIAAGSVSWERMLRRTWSRIVFVVLLIIITIPFVPAGLPIYGKDKLVVYFSYIKKHYGMDFITRFEDNSIHSLPQDYADMIGWKELASIASRAWGMIPEKKSAFIYCENYGEAGAVTIIGKKYGLPEAVCFNESFRYWIPEKFDPDIRSMVYINYHQPGEDVRHLFRKITLIGSISDPDAREFGTSVYLCEEPVLSFNEFWTERTRNLR
ncbi:MAG: glycosyltransferase family 39 protein [Bacteroidales bacterium]|jgi:hypothetical protein